MMSERDMLDQLLQVEPNNRFYRNLHEQYQTRHGLTPRQTECLQQDYQKKLVNLITSNMDKVETRNNDETKKRRNIKELIQEYDSISVGEAHRLYINKKLSFIEHSELSDWLSTQNEERNKKRTAEKTEKRETTSKVAPATNNNTNKEGGDVIVDHRERSKEELEKTFGTISYHYALVLFNTNQISFKEYQIFCPGTRKELWENQEKKEERRI